MRARFSRVVVLIQEYGLENVGMPHVRHLQGKLSEIRLKGRDGIARALYVTASGRRVVVVRVFAKRTQETAAYEITQALERAREIKP